MCDVPTARKTLRAAWLHPVERLDPPPRRTGSRLARPEPSQREQRVLRLAARNAGAPPGRRPRAAKFAEIGARAPSAIFSASSLLCWLRR